MIYSSAAERRPPSECLRRSRRVKLRACCRQAEAPARAGQHEPEAQQDRG